MALIPNSYNNSSISSPGTVTITPTGENHTERTAFPGATAGTYNIVAAFTGNNSPGDRIIWVPTWPITVANIVCKIYDASTGGTQLATITTDGVNLTGAFELVFNASFHWEYQRAKIPA